MDRVGSRGPLARAPGALMSQKAEKLKGVPFEVFQHPYCPKTSKKYRGTLWGKMFFFRKKSLAVPKKNERESLWSRPVRYVTRKNRKNFFGSVRVNRKKRVTIIVAFHFMKRRLKTDRQVSKRKRKTKEEKSIGGGHL